MLWTSHCIGPDFPLPTHLSINSSGVITYSVLCTPSAVWWSTFRKKNAFTCKNKTLEIATQLYWNAPFKTSVEYIIICALLLRHSISKCHGRSNNYHDLKGEMGINDFLRHVMTVKLKENAVISTKDRTRDNINSTVDCSRQCFQWKEILNFKQWLWK